MTPADPKYWLRAARAAARDRGDTAFTVMRDEIATRLDRGEAITNAVIAWDSLSRNPNDTDAAHALFIALDTATSRVTSPAGTAIGLAIVFTVQFREDFSFQLSDQILLMPETVGYVTSHVFRRSVGKPLFDRRLLQHLQLEAAMLTPGRLGLNLRNAIKRCQASCDLAGDLVPAWPEGVTQMVLSKPQPERPYVIFTTVLPGYLWFDGTSGVQEIEKVWMSAGRLRDDYDFAELDQICAKVHVDLQSQFNDIVSTKMNPVPMRFMSAGAAFTQRDPAVRAAQRSLLRSGGHF